MDSAYITLDPEFEAILAEVAAQPDSALLRVKRPQKIRALFEREHVRENATFLSRAEKHLLSTYRCEAASLLRDACRIKLADSSRKVSHASLYDAAAQPHPDALRDRVTRTRAASADVELGPHVWALLGRCVADPLGSQPTVGELAEASLRLEPTDDARIMAALDLVERGAPRTARLILQQIIDDVPEERVHFIAWHNLGMALAFGGDASRAHECYVRACSIEQARLEPWMNRFLLGMQLGLVDDARAASRVIDELVDIESGAVSTFVSAVGLQRRKGFWSPTGISRKIIAALGSEFGPSARRIASAFE